MVTPWGVLGIFRPTQCSVLPPSSRHAFSACLNLESNWFQISTKSVVVADVAVSAPSLVSSLVAPAEGDAAVDGVAEQCAARYFNACNTSRAISRRTLCAATNAPRFLTSRWRNPSWRFDVVRNLESSFDKYTYWARKLTYCDSRISRCASPCLIFSFSICLRFSSSGSIRVGNGIKGAGPPAPLRWP